MGLKIFSLRPAAPAKRLTGPQPVIDGNSLRQAALQASWHRDHRVARRREAWRWAIFWGWKYGRKVGLLGIPTGIAAWLALQLWPSATFQTARDEATALIKTPSAPVSPTPKTGPVASQPSQAQESIRLVPTTSLNTHTGTPPRSNPAESSAQRPLQPLRLTPEIQSSPKESSP